MKALSARILVVFACATVTACSGGSTKLTPQPSGTTLDETPAAASNTTCITPSTAAQNVALPTTAGFTGTLSVGAFSSAGTSCDVTVVFSTGADVVAPSAVGRAANALQARDVRRRDASGAPAPLLSIAINDAFTNNVIIAGAVLNTPSNLNFPNGTYYALVTFGLLGTRTLEFTATNGVLTLASTASPLVLLPGSTATLYLYPRGVTPPAIAPTPTPAPGATATPTPAPTPVPTTTPTMAPTATPAPTPTSTLGTIIASSFTITPSDCFQFGNSSSMETFTAQGVTNAPQGTVFVYQWHNAVSPFTLTIPNSYFNAGYFYSYQNTATITSPNFPLPVSGYTGASLPLTAYLDVLPSTPNSQNAPYTLTDASGNPATATVYLDGGASTCP